MQAEEVTTEKEQKTSELARTMNPLDMPRNFAEVTFWANTLAKANIPDLKGPADALTRILIGMQRGMDPVSSVNNIFNINGRYMMHYTILLADVKKTGKYNYRWLESSGDAAELEFLEHFNGEWVTVGKSRVTLDQAKRMGTKNLDKMAHIMLRARAVGEGVRIYCPDAFNGMIPYAQGEMVDSVEMAVPATSKGDQLAAEMKAKAENVVDAEIVEEPPVEDALFTEPPAPEQEEQK